MLVKNLSSFLVVGFLPYAVNFFLLPLYAKYLESDDFGIIGMITMYIALFGAWAAFQIPSSVGRLYFEYEGDEKKSLFTTIFLGVIASSIIFVAIYIANAELLSSMMFNADGDFSKYIILGSISIFLTGINQLCERWMVVQQRGPLLLLRSLWAQVINVSAGIILVIYFKMGVAGFLLAMIASQLVVSIASVWVLRELLTRNVSFALFKESFLFSYPLVFHALGGIVFMYSSVFIVEKFLPLSVLGVFVIAEKYSQVIKVIVNQVNKVVMPFFTKVAKQSEIGALSKMQIIISVWMLIILMTVFAYTAMCYFFIPKFMGQEYSQAPVLVAILVIGYIFRGFYCFSSATLFYRKLTNKIPKITVAAGVFSIISNVLMIPVFGVYGAALSTVLSFFITYLLADYLAPKDFKIVYDWMEMGKITLLLSGVYIVIFWGATYLPPVAAMISVAITSLLIFYCIWSFGMFDFKEKVEVLRNEYAK